MSVDGVRIDKWLWATRLFKTRPKGAEACHAERIKIGGRSVKPSRAVHPGEIIEIRQPGILKTVRVKELIHKRIGPKEVEQYLEDLTPASEYQRQKEFREQSLAQRERGSGRPTKKDRRETDRFFGL